MDEIAKLYIRHEGEVYRFKIFELTITVERQPGGENVMFDKRYGDASTVYNPDTGVWDMGALTRLIDAYHRLR
jgi:hypothetical protein